MSSLYTWTDSTGNGLEPLLQAELGVSVVDGSEGGETAAEILARFDRSGVGQLSIIGAGHNYDPRDTSAQLWAERNVKTVDSMVTRSRRALVMELTTNSRAAYATTGPWLVAADARARTNAAWAGKYPASVYFRRQELMLAEAAKLPGLTPTDRKDMAAGLLPGIWRDMRPGVNDGHLSDAGKRVLVRLLVAHIRQYSFIDGGPVVPTPAPVPTPTPAPTPAPVPTPTPTPMTALQRLLAWLRR